MSNPNINKVYERVKEFYYSVIKYDYDLPIILNFLNKYSNNSQRECRVLDVGCSYGHKMLGITSAGYEVLGVDVNRQLVEANKKQGLDCITVEYSRNKLSLTDLKFRRRQYRLTFGRGKYVRSWTTKFYHVVDFVSTLLCLTSGGWLGTKDGWVGIFRKI